MEERFKHHDEDAARHRSSDSSYESLIRNLNPRILKFSNSRFPQSRILKIPNFRNRGFAICIQQDTENSGFSEPEIPELQDPRTKLSGKR